MHQFIQNVVDVDVEGDGRCGLHVVYNMFG